MLLDPTHLKLSRFIFVAGVYLSLFLVTSQSVAHSGGLNPDGCHLRKVDDSFHCHKGKHKNESFLSMGEYENHISLNSSHLRVEGPLNFYKREEYLRKWLDIDKDCINTRNEVLMRDSLSAVVFDESGCKVVKGEWYEPSTNKIYYTPEKLAIDHLVPLSEAHHSGASLWSKRKKREFANDLRNPYTLMVMDSRENSAKGGRDPSQWLPKNKLYHCEYVYRWVAVKQSYALEFDAEEKSFIEKMMHLPISMVVPYGLNQCEDHLKAPN